MPTTLTNRAVVGQLRALATSWAETTSGPPTATMTFDGWAVSHVCDAGDSASVVGATNSSTPLLAAAAGPALTASGQFKPDASHGGPVIPAATALDATAAEVAHRSAPDSRVVGTPITFSACSTGVDTALVPPTIVADVTCSAVIASDTAGDDVVAGVRSTGRCWNAAKADTAAASVQSSPRTT
jgi:hypothetical protein